MNIVIRQATPEDAYDFAECHVKSWQTAYKNILPNDYLSKLSIEKRAERYAETLKNQEGSVHYCALSDNDLIGLLVIGKCRDEDLKDTGEIQAIYFLEQYRRNGLGTQLMNFGIQTLKDQGYKKIVLWVLEGNMDAIKFYEKIGFVADGAKKEIVIVEPFIELRYQFII